MMTYKPRIVVIGGGTGSFVILSGLKSYDLDLSAVVTVADSGGSTGRLRSEFGFLPVGDIRQCLAALASENAHNYIRQLLLYRFTKGEGLEGHNLGNLILTALTDLTGSEPKAIEAASGIFRLKGAVYPVSLDRIDLVAYYEDGKRIVGEHRIDEPKHGGGKKITKLTSLRIARIYPVVRRTLLDADLVILAPGDLYTSLLPNIIVKGVSNVVQKMKAPLVYVMNLMTRYSQTDGLTASDHVKIIERYIGRKLDKILVNNISLSQKILNLYGQEKASPVVDDLGRDLRVIKANLLNRDLILKSKSDILQRSLVRHDSQRVARLLISLLK
ncbi:hypothetical protein A2160_02205 [Candidatus Beckwithbacteria bacterium RBG_13_42_9]|uniref:Putative gluconeogenesis factor n=1 Tax=Candidatus Beckwithbacteria bacterium RBG_13_42_9 TaxID=1797457 RepID=A0A1F5E793_9BACT|nr:MAG: hypothetical protein A2160_02205 [Candidatus Beckwithbacteria bacterium RBG_13_42_9]